MIFRLEYKNKALKTARVDIITPTGTGVETVEGTGYPFQLKYEGDKKNKSLMFLSSSAEINIYETPLFNIDTLKTSGEKDIRVNYYIDSVLEWTGFVIPDFFSREIGGDGVVSMVASDRLSVLDSEVLEGLPVTVTLRTLLSLSLAKTGLVLPLKTVVDFATVAGGTNHILNHSIRSQRLTDTKGRSVNCKDIIKSILAATNSKIMQRKGEWWVVNKMQHELGGGRVYTSPTAFTNYVEDLISFTDVTRGAMRTIAPVAGGVGVFQEYGGGRAYPDNYNFQNGLAGWTTSGGFTASTNNKVVTGFQEVSGEFIPIFDTSTETEAFLVNKNYSNYNVVAAGILPLTTPFIKHQIPVLSSDPSRTSMSFELNATSKNNTIMPVEVVLLRPGRETLYLNRDGQWVKRDTEILDANFENSSRSLKISFQDTDGASLAVVNSGLSVSTSIIAESKAEGGIDNISTYIVELRIWGNGRKINGTTFLPASTVLINSASVQFSAASNDNPKGTLYKADQGGESYTKIHDTETTVFGDYLTGGLNGYFYNYAPDDTSSLLAPNGSRSQPAWVNTFTQNTDPLPLLQQTIRQMRRMFSVAHDFIKGEIDVSDFDPLSIFEDCERRFVIVEAEFDFLRGSLQVVLEEVAYQNLTVREYIYSYFGEGDEGIRGISGISAGSSGGGGGIAPEPSWLENEITIDPDSGLLSVDGWHVRGNLIIEGQVNQWLAQQLVVDDARIQVNRRQGGATVDSGLVIYNKDTSTEVSSLFYDVNGIWRAGGQRIYTDAYKPDSDALGGIAAALYATKNWVQTEAVAYDSARLGGFSAASYPRKAEGAVITGGWQFNVRPQVRGTAPGIEFWQTDSENVARWVLDGDNLQAQIVDYNTGAYISAPILFNVNAPSASMTVSAAGNLGIGGSGSFGGDLNLSGGTRFINLPTTRIRDNDGKIMIFSAEGGGQFLFRPSGDATAADQTLIDSTRLRAPNLEIPGTSTLTGAVTAGGNVGTSNFASQALGWRVTPAGQADFRHIYTDELQAKAFTADISQALVGSDILTKSVSKLAANFTVTNVGTTATIYVEEIEGFAGMQVFAVNDRLRFRVFDRTGGGLIIKDVWATVANYVSTTNNVQRYTVTINVNGGVSGQVIYAGSMVLDYGTPGSGVIERTVLDAQGSPYSRIKTWVTNPWTPANYTIHYQSGNLNGLTNSSGWGIRSENTFLTGKLLVGDLTKAGQFMEYENGQLNIKGQITVTGGNAATKADVDAVQVGGRNLALSQSQNDQVLGGYASTFQEGVNLLSSIPLTENEYVLSFEAKTTVDGDIIHCYFYNPSTTTEALTSTGFSGNAGDGSAQVILSTGWNKYWVKYKQNGTATGVQKRVIIGRRNPGFGSGVISVRSIKFELGNKATDWTPAPEDVDAGIAAAAASTSALATRVENTLGLAQLEGISQTLIDGGKVRTSLLEATEIVAQGITAGHVQGLTLDFDKGTVGGFTITDNLIAAGSWDSVFSAGSGVKMDASGRSFMAQYNTPNNRVEMFYRSSTDWGILGKKNNADVFKMGHVNEIAGINFDDSKLFTAKWSLNKDGSFSFADGKIIGTSAGALSVDAGVITGLIQSQNWDGENGTRINLIDGSMDYGNVIHVNANAGEIYFRDLTADRNGVRLGDFDLSPAVSGSSYDQNLSSLAVSGGYSWSITRWVSPSGVGPNELVFTSVSQNTYNFSYPLQTSLGRSFPNLFTGIALQEGYTGGLTAKVTVYLDGIIIQETQSQIPSYYGSFTQPTASLSLPVNFNFTGSGDIKVKIELIGFNGYRDFQGNQYHPTSVVSLAATTIKVTPSTSITELSTKGFQSLWGPTKYFRVYDKAGFDNFVETRGVQQYISPNGTFRLRVSDAGIQKSINGGSTWTTL